VHEPTITLVGNLGNDPDLRYTPNGHAVCDIRVATTPRRQVGDEWEDKETLWFTISCWHGLAEHVAQSLKKGDRVLVSGRLLKQTYVREDGSESVKLVIDAASVGPDLKRFPLEIKRTVRAGSSAELLRDKWDVDHETGEILGENPLAAEEPIAV